MSEEGGFVITLLEKVSGLIIIIIGALVTYYTFTSTSEFGGFTAFFGGLSIFLLALGVFILIAKAE
jgi:hypothetical protein